MYTILCSLFHIYILCCEWRHRVSCNPGWPRTYFVAENDILLCIFLFPFPSISVVNMSYYIWPPCFLLYLKYTGDYLQKYRALVAMSCHKMIFSLSMVTLASIIWFSLIWEQVGNNCLLFLLLDFKFQTIIFNIKVIYRLIQKLFQRI